VALPIIQSIGVVSGAGTPGQGRNNLVAGERVDLSDAEPANSGATYFWEWDDYPLGVSEPTINDATTPNPWFNVDADDTLSGSYRIKCTVNGLESSVEILSKPLPTTGLRVPSFREEDQYDALGNTKGWHESQTEWMRDVDFRLGAQGSVTERTAGVVVPQGAYSKTLRLGRIAYAGSLLGLIAEIDTSITSGSVLIQAKINGVTKLSFNLSAGTQWNNSLVSAGVHALSNGDIVEVTITATGHTNAGGTPAGIAIALYLANSISATPISIPDASNVQKGVLKLTVAPAVPTEPLAVGTNDTRVPSQTENDALAGSFGTPSSGNPYVTDSDPRNSDARTPLAHGLGSAEHNQTTLALLNTKISDATLDDVSGTRDPNAHAIGGAAHSASTLAQLNAKISDATLDDVSGTRNPNAHDLAGAAHNSTTLASLNAKITDATLDTNTASRPPSGSAGGDLGGTYPNPTVNDGADSTAIHDNVAGEIAVVTEKAVPVSGDLLLIEDSAAGNAKKRVQIGNLPGGTDAAAIHDNVAGEIAAIATKLTPVGADRLIIEDSEAANVKKQISLTNAQLAHSLGGSQHTASTFVQVKTKVSDATLAATDVHQTFTKNQKTQIVVLTDAASVAWDAEVSNMYSVTATVGVGATRQLANPTNLQPGMSFIFLFRQDATGGRQLTFDTYFDFGDEGTPDFTTDGANKESLISMVAVSTSHLLCSALKGFT